MLDPVYRVVVEQRQIPLKPYRRRSPSVALESVVAGRCGQGQERRGDGDRRVVPATVNAGMREAPWQRFCKIADDLMKRYDLPSEFSVSGVFTPPL